MWQPKLEARTLQELRLGRSDDVLEVGSGSGYLTSLLSLLAKHVTSVEIVPELNAMASKNLEAYRRDNIKLEIGDAARGWRDGASYDAIVLTGSTPVLPVAFQNSLNIGGGAFVLVWDAPGVGSRAIDRRPGGQVGSANIMGAWRPPGENERTPAGGAL